MDSTSILQEADKIVTADRQDVYGHPFDDFSRIATMWQGYLGIHILPEDVALMQIMVKISRLKNTPGHRDSLVDVAGYARCFDLIREKRESEDHLKDTVNTILGSDTLVKARTGVGQALSDRLIRDKRVSD